jgi:hypothetical protein
LYIIGDNYILSDMLSKISSSKLSDQLDRLWVFNYGTDIGIEIMQQYPFVSWIQMYNDSSYFEVPTIRILHRMSQHFRSSLGLRLDLSITCL